MRRGFYSKLAISNMKKNRRVTTPYLLTGVFMVMMFYMLTSLAWNPQLTEATHTNAVLRMMNLFITIVGIFAVILLFYADSFLMKRRKKELGLYNILGMEKRHIGKMLFWETLYAWLIAVAAGIVCGLLFSKLLFMILGRILHLDIGMGFYISPKGIGVTAILFGCIYLFSYVVHLVQMQINRPVELLRGGAVGEREPKTKWVVAILGAVALAIGYYLSLTIQNPIDALNIFFIAVLLVIAGTYLLFVAGSIALLKMLRKNKNYYYRTRHFTAVSGLIYRMKQNAVGLGSICILATMVLVLVSVTFSLYRGVEKGIENMMPKNTVITLPYDTMKESAEAAEEIYNIAQDLGYETANGIDFPHYATGAIKSGEDFEAHFMDYSMGTNGSEFYFIAAEDYQKFTGQHAELSGNHVLLYSSRGEDMQQLRFLNQDWIVDGKATREGIPGLDEVIPLYVVVVPERAMIWDVCDKNNEIWMELYDFSEEELEGGPTTVYQSVHFDIKGSESTQIEGYTQIMQVLIDKAEHTKRNFSIGYCKSKAESLENGYQFYGSFLFIGVFLAIVFMMGTVLIIYYKQLSEGFEDWERFRIMQNVGMSRAEVRQSIRSQILTIFYLPLVTAAVHCFVAFPLLKKIMDCFNGTDSSVFLPCMIVTLVIFAVIYALVYSMTAKVYYNIVTVRR